MNAPDGPSSALTYTDEEGREVKTSTFLKNRGSCCKTCCRHCPYGFTLKKRGLQFCDYDPALKALAESFLDARGGGEGEARGDIAMRLLSEGLSEPKKKSPSRPILEKISNSSSSREKKSA